MKLDIEQLDRGIVFLEGFLYGIFVFSLPRILAAIKDTWESIKKDSTAVTDESSCK